METIDTVHDFCFTQPARDSHELLAKFARWYQGGDDLDRSIRARFSGLIERALSGQLCEWESEPRGKLALILLLDQFTRNAFRGLPRAYAGDAAALELALSLIDSPADNALSLESRLFCTMPLVHSESLPLQERAVALAHAMADDAPLALRSPWQFGAQRTLHYCSIIRRFGRFPHRNEILGRESTPEELEFLAEQAHASSPLTAARASASL